MIGCMTVIGFKMHYWYKLFCDFYRINLVVQFFISTFASANGERLVR